jgi:hypothetical protein
MMSQERHDNTIELEAVERRMPIDSGVDRRPRMEQPLPVRLVAIADVELPASAGLEVQLDAFYVQMLEFEREIVAEEEGVLLVYRAENFRLRLRLVEGLIERRDYRPTMIGVLSLADSERKLIEREIEYIRQKTVSVGQESLLLQDPAGNWVELIEAKPIM